MNKSIYLFLGLLALGFLLFLIVNSSKKPSPKAVESSPVSQNQDSTMSLNGFDTMNADSNDNLTTSVPINLSQSKLKWSAQKVLVDTNDHFGEVPIKSGFLLFKDNLLSGGNFVIDMRDLTNEDLQGSLKEKIETHLKSADFFDVENFPEAEFEITNVELVNQSGDKIEYAITGNLTIKGMTREIQIPAEQTQTQTGDQFQSKFTIDRTEWDIRYGSDKFFKGLGDNVIDDNITFEVLLMTTK